MGASLGTAERVKGGPGYRGGKRALLHWLRQCSRRLMVREGRSSGGLEGRIGNSEMCSDCGLGSLKHLEYGRAGGGDLLC